MNGELIDSPVFTRTLATATNRTEVPSSSIENENLPVLDVLDHVVIAEPVHSDRSYRVRKTAWTVDIAHPKQVTDS